jgi:hypothetical protein
MSLETHPNAKAVFDYYQRRYASGPLGLWHLCGLASTKNRNNKLVLSSIIVANKGSYKSQIMKSFGKTYHGYTWDIPNQPTDRSIVREWEANNDHLNNKIWYIDDAAVSFPTLEGTRQERLIGLFTTGVMDGTYSYADFSQTKRMDVRFGLYINIAFSTYHQIKSVIQTNTFTERVIPFNFVISDEILNLATEEYMMGYDYGVPPKVNLKSTRMQPIKLNDFLAEFRYGRDMLHLNCDLAPPRANQWYKLMLDSLAIIEGRDTVTIEDVRVANQYLIPHMSLNMRIIPIERAIMSLITVNPLARFEDLREYLSSPECVKAYPHEVVDFMQMEDGVLSSAFNRAKTLLNMQNEIKDKRQVVFEYETGKGNTLHWDNKQVTVT